MNPVRTHFPNAFWVCGGISVSKINTLFRRYVQHGSHRGSGLGAMYPAVLRWKPCLRLCYRAAAGYMCVCECTCIYVASEGAQTRRLSSTSPSLAGWPVAGGGRGTGTATTTALAAAQALSLLPLRLCPAHGVWRSLGT